MDNSVIARQIVDMARVGSDVSATDSVKSILDEMNLLFSAEHTAIVNSVKDDKRKFLSDHKIFLMKICRDYGVVAGNKHTVTLELDVRDNTVNIKEASL